MIQKIYNPLNQLIFKKVQDLIGYPVSPESCLDLLPIDESTYKELEEEFSVSLRGHIFSIEIPRDLETIDELVKEIDIQYVANYFKSESGTFKGLIDVVDYKGEKVNTVEHKWKIRGKNLIEKIKVMQDSNPDLSILDLGCGYNLYKKHLRNVTGVDPYVTDADVISRLSDFKPTKKYDIIICFGPMNWYTFDEQVRNMLVIKESLAKNGVCYWSHVHNYYKVFQTDARNAHTWVAGSLEDAFKNNAFYFYDRIWKYNQYFNWTENALIDVCKVAGLSWGEFQYDDCGCYRPPMWRLFCELRHQ
jgi:hypothetical protein